MTLNEYLEVLKLENKLASNVEEDTISVINTETNKLSFNIYYNILNKYYLENKPVLDYDCKYWIFKNMKRSDQCKVVLLDSYGDIKGDKNLIKFLISNRLILKNERYKLTKETQNRIEDNQKKYNTGLTYKNKPSRNSFDSSDN